jgi:NodT family efflux transporter outer membrane factor (OMF) lipoprotein
MKRRLTLVAAAALLTSACTVGPDYHRPALSLPTQFDETTPSRPSAPVSLPQEWWKQIGSEPLSRLVERALRQNPSIEAAQAALASARESVQAQEGAYLPQVSATYGFQRNKNAAVLASPLTDNAYVFNLHTAALNVSYAPDLFGLNRRTVESLTAQANSQRYALAATQLTLVGNLIVAAANEAALRDQIELTDKQIQLQEQALLALSKMRDKGANSEADVSAQEFQLATLQAALPPLRKQLEQQRNGLKNLLGAYPSEVLTDSFRLGDFKLASDIPLTLPSSLLDARPDIRMAEENLHAASAAIGIAVANRLPQITLGGSLVGQTSASLGQLFNSANNFWSLAGGLAAPLYSGGTLSARERAARANYDQAAAVYRQTVLSAFQSVADALSAVRNDAVATQKYQRAVDAAKRSLAIARQQIRLGDLSVLAALPLEQAALQAQLALSQSQANQLSDIAALGMALGGGWQVDNATH